MKVNPPGTEIVRSDLFICLETVSLSLVSAQEGCLTSLRCPLSLHLGIQLVVIMEDSRQIYYYPFVFLFRSGKEGTFLIKFRPPPEAGV